VPAISPGVRELRVHNHFPYFAEVAIFPAFLSGIKGKLKTHFGLKFRKIEIPRPLHSVFPGGIKELYHLFLRAFTIKVEYFPLKKDEAGVRAPSSPR
jgi:hypothetical protein